MAYGFSSGTLAQVATILAKEYGVRVRIGGTNAYTSRDDSNKWYINIPAIATSDPYYMDIMRCYLDHEAGHVRFSDMNLLESNRDNLTYILKSVWNIFEDIYVERKMSRSFPGCARNLRVGAERIFAEHDVTEDAAGSVLNYILMKSRFNVGKSDVFKEPIEVLESILPDELLDIVNKYVNQLPQCNSTKANFVLAKDLCDEIEQYVKDSAESSPSQQDEAQPSQSGGGNGDGNVDVNADLGDIPDVPDSQQSGGGGASGKKLSDYDTKEAVLNALMNASHSDGRDMDSYDMADRVNTILSDMKASSSGSLAAGSGCGEWIIYRNLDAFPEAYKKRFVGKLSVSDRNDALKESAKLSSQLSGLLQTIVMNRGGFATRGKLDPKRLARVAVGRPDIFSSRVDKKGLDTEVVISVDFSGSMSGGGYRGNATPSKSKMRIANQALMSILIALKGIQGVRSMAYMYSDFIAHVCNFTDTFTRNSRMIIKTAGGTPTGDAVQHAMTLFTSNARRKILLLLTDGEPDDNEYFKASLRLLKKQGVEIVGVGILDDCISHDMSKDEHIVIKDLQELSPKLFKILRDKLVHNA